MSTRQPPRPARAVADAVLYEGYLLYPTARAPARTAPAGSSACSARPVPPTAVFGEPESMTLQRLLTGVSDGSSLDGPPAVPAAAAPAGARREPAGHDVPELTVVGNAAC